MTRMLRRLITVVVVAALTFGATLWWLYEGDLEAATQDVAATEALILP
jgi:hypothetical protein